MKKLLLFYLSLLALDVFSDPKPISPEWLGGKWRERSTGYIWEFKLRPDRALDIKIYDNNNNLKYSWWCKHIAEEFYAVYTEKKGEGMNITYVNYDEFYFNVYHWDTLNPNLARPKFNNMYLIRIK